MQYLPLWARGKEQGGQAKARGACVERQWSSNSAGVPEERGQGPMLWIGWHWVQGVEATLFATLMSILNGGAFLGSAFGSALTKVRVHTRAGGRPCMCACVCTRMQAGGTTAGGWAYAKRGLPELLGCEFGLMLTMMRWQ